MWRFEVGSGRVGVPNPWGLYTMGGNVAEWVADRFDRYPDVDEVDPSGPNGEGLAHIARGGHAGAADVACRSAARGLGFAPTLRSPDIGLRRVRSLPSMDGQ